MATINKNKVTSTRPITTNLCTAIIYADDDLGTYIVALHYDGARHYIGSNANPRQFLHLAAAQEAALSYHADVIYVALKRHTDDINIHPELARNLHQPLAYIRI